MGYLIEHTGHNYYAAFVVAYILQVLGLVALFTYRHLMQRPRADVVEKVDAPSSVALDAP